MSRAVRFSLLAVFVVAALTRLLPTASAAEDLPGELRGVGLDQRLNELVPLDLEFRDEEGRAVRLGNYFGERPVILVLAYFRCPMLCNQVLNGLVDSLKRIAMDPRKEFEVVVVSFDPRETPALATAKKAVYLESYGRPGADAGWHFLTGRQDAIRALTDSVGFHYVYDPANEQFAHASGIMVLTPQGRLARYFYGIDYPPRDLRFSLIEASEGRIGSPVDRLLLLCFHYDPTTGKYGFVVMSLVRLAGIVTLLILVPFLVRAWLKGKGWAHTRNDKSPLTTHPSPLTKE